MILIGVLPVTHGYAGVIIRAEVRKPVCPFVPADRNGAVVAVKVSSGKVEVGLQFTEVGQHFGERPLVIAPLGPIVVVLGYAPEQHLAVDGAGAAGGFAPGNHHRFGLQGRALGLKVPAMGPVGGTPNVIAAFDILGQVLEHRVVRACFQQQHALVGVFGQSSGEDTPGGPAPNDYVIVLHLHAPIG